jgi:hypothetical protein
MQSAEPAGSFFHRQEQGKDKLTSANLPEKEGNADLFIEAVFEFCHNKKVLYTRNFSANRDFLGGIS